MAIPPTRQQTVLSYKLYVRGTNSQMITLGQVQSLDLSESRDVTFNYVIGNDPPDEADALIPGVVKNRQVRLKRVRLFSKGLLQAFGRDDQSILASLADQNTPIDLVATILDPSNGKTKTITFKDGFLSEIASALNIEGDIREIENATYTFRTRTESAFA